jgi:hypothetical protein
MRSIVIVLMLSCSAANAAVYTYDIDWTGANGYSMSGSFSFENSTAGSLVTAHGLLSFSIEGFLNGSSLGSYSGPLSTGSEFDADFSQFNFYTATETFKLGFAYGSGDYPAQVPSQMWNIYNTPTGIGFGSGTGTQALWLDGNYIVDSSILTGDSTLTATLTSVPIPAAAWLFGSALAGLGWLRRKHKA